MIEHSSEWLAAPQAMTQLEIDERRTRRYASRIAALQSAAQLEISEHQARRGASRLTALIEARESAAIVSTKSHAQVHGTASRSAAGTAAGPNEASGRDAAAQNAPDMAVMLARLQEEIGFLRSTLEDHTRAEAEFHAALREELRMQREAPPSPQESPDASHVATASHVADVPDATKTPLVVETLHPLVEAQDGIKTVNVVEPPNKVETSHGVEALDTTEIMDDAQAMDALEIDDVDLMDTDDVDVMDMEDVTETMDDLDALDDLELEALEDLEEYDVVETLDVESPPVAMSPRDLIHGPTEEITEEMRQGAGETVDEPLSGDTDQIEARMEQIKVVFKDNASPLPPRRSWWKFW